MQTHILIIISLLCSAIPVFANAQQYEQEFVITAYYSPEPGQCCYVKGGLLADRVLNGDGTHGADGTAVYPGMAAAPPSYEFGTRIILPGIGTVTVHDRGGAIQEWEGGVHRLDLWVGSGEEGLARALAFGVQRVHGKVYPPGTQQPAESIALESLPAPVERLLAYAVQDDDLIGLEVKEGDRSYSARLLQETLRTIGYFPRAVTGFFGPETRGSLEQFVKDFGLQEPVQSLTARTAAFLKSAVARMGARAPIAREIDPGSKGSHVASAQRVLRFLGYYKGRTNGIYDETLTAAVLRFQIDRGIVSSAEDLGAGRIGPSTKTAILAEWNRRLVANRAERELMLARVDGILADRGKYIDRFLSEGNSGNDVAQLQRMLAERGFFPLEELNGHFGPLTKSSVLAFQLDRGIVQSDRDTGAGTVGPQTLKTLREEQQIAAYRLVRAQGWSVL